MVRPAGGGNEQSGGFSALDFIHISAQEGVGDINGSTPLALSMPKGA